MNESQHQSIKDILVVEKLTDSCSSLTPQTHKHSHKCVWFKDMQRGFVNVLKSEMEEVKKYFFQNAKINTLSEKLEFIRKLMEHKIFCQHIISAIQKKNPETYPHDIYNAFFPEKFNPCENCYDKNIDRSTSTIPRGNAADHDDLCADKDMWRGTGPGEAFGKSRFVHDNKGMVFLQLTGLNAGELTEEEKARIREDNEPEESQVQISEFLATQLEDSFFQIEKDWQRNPSSKRRKGKKVKVPKAYVKGTPSRLAQIYAEHGNELNEDAREQIRDIIRGHKLELPEVEDALYHVDPSTAWLDASDTPLGTFKRYSRADDGFESYSSDNPTESYIESLELQRATSQDSFIPVQDVTKIRGTGSICGLYEDLYNPLMDEIIINHNKGTTFNDEVTKLVRVSIEEHAHDTYPEEEVISDVSALIESALVGMNGVYCPVTSKEFKLVSSDDIDKENPFLKDRVTEELNNAFTVTQEEKDEMEVERKLEDPFDNDLPTYYSIFARIPAFTIPDYLKLLSKPFYVASDVKNLWKKWNGYLEAQETTIFENIKKPEYKWLMYLYMKLKRQAFRYTLSMNRSLAKQIAAMSSSIESKEVKDWTSEYPANIEKYLNIMQHGDSYELWKHHGGTIQSKLGKFSPIIGAKLTALAIAFTNELKNFENEKIQFCPEHGMVHTIRGYIEPDYIEDEQGKLVMPKKVKVIQKCFKCHTQTFTMKERNERELNADTGMSDHPLGQYA